MKVLVTGGGGGVGSHVVPGLLKKGYEVIAFDRRQVEQPEGVAVLVGDLCDLEDVRRALNGVDAVVHLAAILPPFSEDNPSVSEAVNVGGTKNLITAMEASPTCRRLILTSTTAVHGSKPDRVYPIGVNEPLDPPDNYSKQKIAAEEAVRASKLEWTILRIAATPPTNLKRAPKGGLGLLLTIPPDSRIEILHPDDAATAYANCVECKEAFGKTLFLGGGKQNGCQVTGYQMACGMTRAFGMGTLPRHVFNPEKGDAHAEWLDTTESQSLLKFQSRSFEDLIRDIQGNLGAIYYVSRLLSPITRFVITNFLSKKKVH